MKKQTKLKIFDFLAFGNIILFCLALLIVIIGAIYNIEILGYISSICFVLFFILFFIFQC